MLYVEPMQTDDEELYAAGGHETSVQSQLADEAPPVADAAPVPSDFQQLPLDNAVAPPADDSPATPHSAPQTPAGALPPAGNDGRQADGAQKLPDAHPLDPMDDAVPPAGDERAQADSSTQAGGGSAPPYDYELPLLSPPAEEPRMWPCSALCKRLETLAEDKGACYACRGSCAFYGLDFKLSL